MLQENFVGYSNQKAERKNFKPFWSYIDFGKVLKKSEKSKQRVEHNLWYKCKN
jgi:hypothetical protein